MKQTDNKGQGMNFEMKMSYKVQKNMKKMYGKNLGREISFGRNLLKFLKDQYQPERSKREDGINTLRCGHCENEYDICSDPNHMYRCGALNTMEKNYD